MTDKGWLYLMDLVWRTASPKAALLHGQSTNQQDKNIWNPFPAVSDQDGREMAMEVAATLIPGKLGERLARC